VTVPPDQDGVRLNVLLEKILPDCGPRARKRLWRLRRVLLNGLPGRPTGKARAGDEILVGSEPEHIPFMGDLPAIVALGNGYVALHKPAGLHTVRLAGGDPANLEEFLALHWADLWRARRPDLPAPPPPRLVTRLDRETSGLVLALLGASPAAEKAFRALERVGLVEKSYLGLSHGAVPGPLLIRAGLDTRRRRITKVLSWPDPDATRHTRVRPLGLLDGAELKGVWGEREFFPEGPFSLIQVRILRGSRHQIRAHLACSGFPLVGDSLYGEAGGAARRLYLHHAAVSLPGFCALDLPDWGLGEEAAQFPCLETAPAS
jgi:23S rRNA pseudouridine1911/1915/1917 synthase